MSTKYRIGLVLAGILGVPDVVSSFVPADPRRGRAAVRHRRAGRAVRCGHAWRGGLGPAHGETGRDLDDRRQPGGVRLLPTERTEPAVATS
ncbi:hypothetical protein [Cryptosporangium phraense]|uniref:Uncharacterized protein n=1 Tax=Cryptosporangium phraense TaxID=2593070 RepID=A0A545AX88_9ACTN|nr:hypothetical protein [Cryptosporangium phraense]TQS45953.1 hypothetical protein FL583_05520 [Cryptosporangium phraense]